MSMHSDSGVLRGISSKSASAPLLSLANLVAIPQNVKVMCLSDAGNASSYQITLAAHETRFVQTCMPGTTLTDVASLSDSFPSLGSPHSFGLQITGDGGPSSLAAYGITPQTKENKTTFSSIAFDDATYHRGSVVFTGVPVGATTQLSGRQYVPNVTVANFSAAPRAIVVKASRTADSLTGTDVVLATTIPAYASASFDLQMPSSSPEMQNSFEITSDGAPADVLAKMYSYVRGESNTIELQAKDEIDQQNGGNHPWTLNDGSEPYLLLYNSGDTARSFEVSIGSKGVEWEKGFQLSANETRMVSVRNLIASRAPDDKGRLLSPTLTNGSIQWFAGRLHGRGRLAQIYANQGRARNFSCGGAYWVCGSYYYTGQTTLSSGGTSSMGITPTMCTNIMSPSGTGGPTSGCSSGLPAGQQSGQFSYNWSTYPYNVINIQGSTNAASVQVAASEAGTATLTGTVSDTYGCRSSSSQNFTVQVPCPTGVVLDVDVLHPLPDSEFPNDRTGVGILTEMAVTPSSTNFDGALLLETVTPTNNTCPSSIKSLTDFPIYTLSTGSQFWVGMDAQWELQPYPAQHNQFYDSHRALSASDVLSGSGSNQCTATATQVYYCNGTPIATFHLTNTYTHGTLSGQSVTNVQTTKQ